MNYQILKNKTITKFSKYSLYPILGLLVFYGNSQLNLNYFVKGYLSLLELQVGILIIYFLSSKLRKGRAKNKKENYN